MDYIIRTLQSHHWGHCECTEYFLHQENCREIGLEIMNVLPVPRSVYGGYFVHILAVYLQCISPVHHPMPLV